MPTNLYGPKDNFDLEKSHVLPALMRKVHEAKLAGDASVSIWGGKPEISGPVTLLGFQVVE